MTPSSSSSSVAVAAVAAGTLMFNSSARTVRAEVGNRPSDRLIALLIFSKTDTSPDAFRWTDVAKALGELYHPVMTVETALHHLVQAFQEMGEDARFEIDVNAKSMPPLLLAPVKGPHSVDWLGPKSLSTSYTVEQFYNSMVSYMMSYMRLARVDWLFEPTTGGR